MNNATSTWISRSVDRLRPAKGKAAAAKDKPKDGSGEAQPREVPERSTHERLQATLRRGGEALSPRALRQLLAQLQDVLAPRVSEIEGGRRAQAVATWYGQAEPAQRRDLWLLMGEQFVPDAARMKNAQQRYQAALGTADEPQAEAQLRRALNSPRTRLLQRFAAFPEGMRFLVDLRAELLPHLKADQCLLPLEAELEQLFSTWFDVAFLELKRLSWDSPASLIEKLIKYEAVHDIRSWDDLKNRLDSDRRCYGFFHPRLPNEPLIFVEVALTDEISDSITPLLDESAAPSDIQRASTAIFYSISNTQAGLRGVSFGDSLIKHVVETLQQEFPRLRHFATLSPIPGFRAWLQKNCATQLELLDAKRLAELGRAVGFEPQERQGSGGPCAGRSRQGAGAAAQVTAAPAAPAMGRALSGARAAGRQAAGSRGALSPGQWRARGAAELGGRPLGQGPQAVLWPDGQLPVRLEAHRQAPRPAGSGQGAGVGRHRGSVPPLTQ